MTDMVGTTIATARYDVWGNTLSRTGRPARYGYTGREPNATGLIYYRARYYDPSVGRFTQRDPKGFIDGINRYAYAINNPVNYTDPRGTSVFNNQLTSTVTASSSYYSSSIRTSANAAAYYSQIKPGRQSLRSNSFLDGLQIGLDIVGLVPGIGEPADLVNAGISYLRGNNKDAALSLAGAIPFVGMAATAGKWGGRASDVFGVAKKGITVIGHLPGYPKVAIKMKANYLKPSKDWNFQKQGEFIKEVANRGDNVFIGTKIRQGPSVLKKEIKQLIKLGYRPKGQGSMWLIKN